MSIRALRGIEMTCLTRDGFFDLEYAGQRTYTNRAGDEIKDLMDMGCFNCSAAYFTRESSAIEFCPACGSTERKRWESFQDLQGWSNGQDWRFLGRNGLQAFGCYGGGEWFLRFGESRDELEASRRYDEVLDLLAQDD
jgi:hypothetical protein